MTQPPTPIQLSVLRGILGSNADTLSCVETLNQNVQSLTPSVKRLFPFIEDRLSSLNLKPPPFFEPNFRTRVRLMNQHILAGSELVQKILNAHQIETIPIKGITFLGKYYPDLSLRKMNDADLWVPRAQAPLALQILTALKWTPVEPEDSSIATVDRKIKYTHSVDLSQNGFHPVDLHWHVLNYCPDDRFDRTIREKTISSAEFAYRRQIDQTDEFFIALVHGAGSPFDGDRDCLWVVDSVTLLHANQDRLDWDRILYLSREWELSLLIENCLRFLNDNFQVKILDEALARLSANRPSRWEKLENKTYARCPGQSVWGRMPHLILYYRRLGYSLTSPRNLIDYLKFVWGTKNVAGILFSKMIRCLRRLRLHQQGQ